MNGTIKCTLLVLAMMCSMLAGCSDNNTSDFSTIGIFPSGGQSAWKVKQSTVFSNNTTVVTNYSYDPTAKVLAQTNAKATSGAGTETTTTTYTGYDTFGNPSLVSAITVDAANTTVKTSVTTNTYVGGTLYASTTKTTIGGTTTSFAQGYSYTIYGKVVSTSYYNGDITVNPAAPLVKTDISSYDTALNLNSQVITDFSVTPSLTTTTTWTITEYQNVNNVLYRPKTVLKYQSIAQGSTVLLPTTLVSTTTNTYITDGSPANGQLASYTEQFVPGNPINNIKGVSSYNTDGNLTNSTITTTYSSSATNEETLAATWIIP